MRRHLCLISIVGLILSVGSVKADDAKARQTVDKAIKALGGADKIAKYPCSTFKEKGTYYGMGDGVPYEGVYAVHLPDRFSMEIQGAFKLVVNGKQGWTKSGDATKEMTAEELDVSKGNLYHGWVASLVPLKEKEYKLSEFGADTINGRAAVGVNVNREGRPTVTLLFDKENGLLLKSSTIVRSPENNNKEVVEETIYSEFKEVEGIPSATKVLINRDGKKFVETEYSEYKLLEKLDDSVFGKP
ncbi:MAG: hypothetical protein HZA46_16060 [Planctomycetales bacterium]|nr:hypothetical protein [Planctomycetales bacterium]